MIKEHINIAADQIEELTNNTLDSGYSLLECFPAEHSKLIKIDGKQYKFRVIVELENK